VRGGRGEFFENGGMQKKGTALRSKTKFFERKGKFSTPVEGGGGKSGNEKKRKKIPGAQGRRGGD